MGLFDFSCQTNKLLLLLKIMLSIIFSLILIISLTNASNLNNNNEFTFVLSVYNYDDYGICTVKIDDNQESNHNFNLIYNSSSVIKSIDFNYNGKQILWLEDDAIKSVFFDFQQNTQINIDKVNVIIESEAKAFSLDWIHGYIYYQNGKKRQIIAVNSTNPKKFIVIINETKENVGDIKVDPTSGYLYWSQWDNSGSKAQIIRANQDGTNQTDISQMGYLKSPISLAIDFDHQIIYFIDNLLFIMGSIDKSGQFRIFYRDRDLTQYSRSSDFFRNHFYWNFAKSVYRIYLNYFNRDDLKIFIRSEPFIERIKILDSSRQPPTTNRCNNNNCSDLCIPSGSNNYRCVSPQIDNITSPTYCKDSINESFDSSQTDCPQFPTTSQPNEYNEYNIMLWSSVIIILFALIGISIAVKCLCSTHNNRGHNYDSANVGQLEYNQNEEYNSANSSAHNSAHNSSFNLIPSQPPIL